MPACGTSVRKESSERPAPSVGVVRFIQASEKKAKSALQFCGAVRIERHLDPGIPHAPGKQDGQWFARVAGYLSCASSDVEFGAEGREHAGGSDATILAETQKLRPGNVIEVTDSPVRRNCKQ